MPRKGLYRIPPEEELKRAICGILEDYGMVGSLASLTSLVNMRLSTENPSWRVSQRRVKHTAASMRRVEIEIISADSNEVVENPKCLVCGNPMKPVMNRTLFGDVVTLGYHCTVCGYRTGLKRKIPIRYIFRIR